jgi:hypothetical protein
LQNTDDACSVSKTWVSYIKVGNVALLQLSPYHRQKHTGHVHMYSCLSIYRRV